MSKQQPKPKCLYCGQNPVPHFLTWYFETVNTILTPLRKLLLYNPLSVFLGQFIKRHGLDVFLVKALLVLKIFKRQDVLEHCRVPRARVLWEEAKKRGIEFYELMLFGRPFDSYVAIKGGRTIVFSGLPRPKNYSGKVLEILDDKIELKKVLQKHHLPVAEGQSVWNWPGAVKIFKALPKPVIVKPRAGSRGRHTTTFIYTEEQLKAAYRVAKQLCFWVVVEQHLPGPVYRGTVVDYVTRGVLKGEPPSVVGDGQSSIAQLLEQKNQNKPAGVNDIIVTELTKQFLARQNLNLETVLATGQVVTVSEKIGVSYGGSSAEELPIAHPDTVALFEQAAKILNDPMVGFDFIIPDITVSFREQLCGFIEANSLPFINLHHSPLLGQPINVAKYVWEMIGF